MILIRIICIILIALCTACKMDSGSQNQESRLPDSEELIRINRELVNREVAANESLARTEGWDYTKLPSGLIYEILYDREGTTARSGDKLSMSYEIQNMEGQELYSSALSGKLLEFTVDHDEIEAAINQIALLLSPGDSVRMLVPPHLAFGLTGDGKKVGARTSLIYYLKLINTEKPF